MAYILGVSASPRRVSNTEVLMDRALAGAAAAGAEVEHIKLRLYAIGGCVGCESCRKDKICTKLRDGMQLLYPKIERARGLILGSPTHNYNVTAWMKAFIDRLYCYYDFTDDHPRAFSSRLAGQGRRAAVFTVYEQTDPRHMGVTLEALRLPLIPLGYEVTAELAAGGSFAPGAVKKDPELLARMRQMGAELARSF